MSNFLPTRTVVKPSYEDPGLIIDNFQLSGFLSMLTDGAPKVRLSPGDQYVYKNGLSAKTRSAAAQSGGTYLPSADLIAQQYSVPAYKIRVRLTQEADDEEAAGNWGIALPQTNTFLAQMAIFQQLRNTTLYGFNPANNEGLKNTAGATELNLPSDSFGNTGVLEYDAGQMFNFLTETVVEMLSKCFQLGLRDVTVKVLAPQRIFGLIAISKIVQLTSYQRDGAGSNSSAGSAQEVLSRSGIGFEWAYDDTLIGKGDAGSDLVIMTLNDIKTGTQSVIDTNVFGKTSPRDDSVNNVYMDMAAPREIPTPVTDGGISKVYELRATPGWNFRPQALYLISMPYSNVAV